MKLYLQTVSRLENNKQEFTSEETTFNKDQSRTIRRDIYLTEDEAASPVSIMKSAALIRCYGK